MNMVSRKPFLIFAFSIVCVICLAEKPAAMNAEDTNHSPEDTTKSEGGKKKKRSSEGSSKRPTSCESSIVQESLKKLFKDEKDRKEIGKLAAEIARRTSLESDGDAKKLLALAKKNLVCVVDAIAAITQPESGMDENQVHKLIQVASNELKESSSSRKLCAQTPPEVLTAPEITISRKSNVTPPRENLVKGLLGAIQRANNKSNGYDSKVREFENDSRKNPIQSPADARELNFRNTLQAVAGNSGEGMESAVAEALRAGRALDPHFNTSKLHVLLHGPDLIVRNLSAVDKAMRDLVDKAAQDSLIAELEADSNLRSLRSEDFKAFAGLLRAYQNHDFAGDPDEGHEKAEGLAEFAIEHGITGALPALVSKSKARYCLFAGADPQKLTEIEKELAEKVEAIADKYGYKHLDAEKMAAALRKMGNSAADSEDFRNGANALLGEMIHDPNKMSLADALFFADQTNLVPGRDKKKAFAKLVKDALLGEPSPGIDFGDKTPKEKQSINSDISEIQAESDPQKVRSLTTDLLKKAKKMGLNTENVLTKLTSDLFLLSADAEKLAEKAGEVIPKRQAMLQANALMEAEQSAGKDAIKDMAKLAKLDVLGGLGGVEDGGDKTAPQKSATWKTLADKVLAKAGTDEKVRDALQKMSDNKYWMGPRAKYIKDHLPKDDKTAMKGEGALQAEGETTMKAKGTAPTARAPRATGTGAPSVANQLVSAAGNLLAGNRTTAAINLGGAYLANRNGTPKKKTETKRETATRKETPTGMTSSDADLAAKMGAGCVQCHKEQRARPQFSDNASPQEILAAVKKKVGDSPEKIAEVLADMTSRAILEQGGHSKEEALAFVRALDLKGKDGRTELSKTQEFLQPFEGALPAEPDNQGDKGSNKPTTRKTSSISTPYGSASNSTTTSEIATNRTPPPGYIPGATATGNPSPANSVVAQPPEVGLQVGGGRVLSAPSANDQSTGVVNFVIGNDGRPLVVRPSADISAPLHVRPADGRLPNYALVKNDKGYFYTNGQGQIPANAKPIAPGEPINGSFFGLDPETHVAMVYDGPGKVRFVPSAAAKRDSESFKVMASRLANANNGVAPALKIPKVNPPTAFAERENALKAAGYNPANFDESSPYKMVSLVRPGTPGATLQPLVIDATRKVQGTGNVTVANTGFAFVGNQAAKLLAAPSSEALKLNGDTEIEKSRSGLHVDVNTAEGKAERVWVAKDVSGTYLIRVPLTKDSNGTVVGPDPDGQTRVERLLDGEGVTQGLAFLQTTPTKPFAEQKAREDINDPRNRQLLAYAQEEAAATTPVAPATGNATAEPPREAVQPRTFVQPPPRQATPTPQPQPRAQVRNQPPLLVRAIRARADIRQERRANFRGLFR
jgi:hypothetical protein